MPIRHLEVTIRLTFADDLTDDDRTEIKDSVIHDLQYSATNREFDTGYDLLDFTTVSEWTAKAVGR